MDVLDITLPFENVLPISDPELSRVVPCKETIEQVCYNCARHLLNTTSYRPTVWAQDFLLPFDSPLLSGVIAG